jgi:Tfp pilus assembly protein PilV
MTSSFKRTGGFTIVEVAMATAVLAIGLAGMVQAMGIGSEMLDTARKQTIASQVIQSEIEHLRMLPWTAGSPPQELSLPPGSTERSSDFVVDPESSLAKVAPASVFSNCTLTVQLANERSDLRQVTITVSWTGITGKTHSRSTNVYIGKYGLNVAYQKL